MSAITKRILKFKSMIKTQVVTNYLLFTAIILVR